MRGGRGRWFFKWDWVESPALKRRHWGQQVSNGFKLYKKYTYMYTYFPCCCLYPFVVRKWGLRKKEREGRMGMDEDDGLKSLFSVGYLIWALFKKCTYVLWQRFFCMYVLIKCDIEITKCMFKLTVLVKKQ